MGPLRRERQLILFGIAALAGAGLLAWLVYQLRAVLLLLYVSLLLAMGLSPAVRWIERQRFGGKPGMLPRWMAILLLYATFLTFGGIVLALIVPPIAGQAKELGQHMPQYLDRAQAFLISRGWVEPSWNWNELLIRAPSPGAAFAGVLGAVQGLLGVVGTFLALLVLPYYLLVDAEGLQRSALRFVAPERRARVQRITSDVAIKVGAWLSGQLFLCFVIGTAVTVALWALGVPFFYILGLVAAIGEAIPVIGPIVSAIPAILVGATVSWKTALFVALLFWAIQSVENNFLVPRVMQRQVGLRTVTVLVALLAGSKLFGVVGLLLAVPTTAILQVLVEEFLEDPKKNQDRT